MADRHDKRKARATSGRSLKLQKTKMVQVSPPTSDQPDGVWFKCNNMVTMPKLFISGSIPTPILAAVDRFQGFQQKVASGRAQEAVEGMQPGEKEALIDMMRRVALQVVLDPKLTDSKKLAAAEEDTLWVGGYSDCPEDLPEQTGGIDRRKDEDGDLSFDQLMMIYRFVGRENGVLMAADAADDFRPQSTTSIDPVGPNGDAIQSEAVILARTSDGATVAVERFDHE